MELHPYDPVQEALEKSIMTTDSPPPNKSGHLWWGILIGLAISGVMTWYFVERYKAKSPKKD